MCLKKIILKGSVLLALSLSYSISVDAMTVSWTNMCDIFWSGFSVDFTKDQTISGLKLQDSPMNIAHSLPIWCYSVPNVTSGDESHVILQYKHKLHQEAISS